MRLLIALIFGVAVAFTEDVVRHFGPAERMLGYWLGHLQCAIEVPLKKDLAI